MSGAMTKATNAALTMLATPISLMRRLTCRKMASIRPHRLQRLLLLLFQLQLMLDVTLGLACPLRMLCRQLCLVF